MSQNQGFLSVILGKCSSNKFISANKDFLTMKYIENRFRIRETEMQEKILDIFGLTPKGALEFNEYVEDKQLEPFTMFTGLRVLPQVGFYNAVRGVLGMDGESVHEIRLCMLFYLYKNKEKCIRYYDHLTTLIIQNLEDGHLDVIQLTSEMLAVEINVYHFNTNLLQISRFNPAFLKTKKKMCLLETPAGPKGGKTFHSMCYLRRHDHNVNYEAATWMNYYTPFIADPAYRVIKQEPMGLRGYSSVMRDEPQNGTNGPSKGIPGENETSTVIVSAPPRRFFIGKFLQFLDSKEGLASSKHVTCTTIPFASSRIMTEQPIFNLNSGLALQSMNTAEGLQQEPLDLSFTPSFMSVEPGMKTIVTSNNMPGGHTNNESPSEVTGPPRRFFIGKFLQFLDSKEGLASEQPIFNLNSGLALQSMNTAEGLQQEPLDLSFTPSFMRVEPGMKTIVTSNNMPGGHTNNESPSEVTGPPRRFIGKFLQFLDLKKGLISKPARNTTTPAAFISANTQIELGEQPIDDSQRIQPQPVLQNTFAEKSAVKLPVSHPKQSHVQAISNKFERPITRQEAKKTKSNQPNPPDMPYQRASTSKTSNIHSSSKKMNDKARNTTKLTAAHGKKKRTPKCGITRNGKKMLKCRCGRFFKQFAHLKRHVTRNLSPKEHRCPKCEKIFGEYSDMIRHVYGVHLKNSLPCPHCERLFSYRQPLVTHCKREHRGLPLPEKKQRGSLIFPVID